MVCVACVDASVNMLSAVSGRRLHPALVLDSKTSVLRCSGLHLLVITSKGALFVWWVNFCSFIEKHFCCFIEKQWTPSDISYLSFLLIFIHLEMHIAAPRGEILKNFFGKYLGQGRSKFEFIFDVLTLNPFTTEARFMC